VIHVYAAADKLIETHEHRGPAERVVNLLALTRGLRLWLVA